MFLDRRNYSDVQLNSLKLNSLTIYQGFKMVFSLKSRLHRLEIGSENFKRFYPFHSLRTLGVNPVNEGLKASRMNHLQHLMWTFSTKLFVISYTTDYFAINVL